MCHIYKSKHNLDTKTQKTLILLSLNQTFNRIKQNFDFSGLSIHMDANKLQYTTFKCSYLNHLLSYSLTSSASLNIQ